MKNEGEIYLKKKKKKKKIHGKIRKNVFKSSFLIMNGSRLIDYHHY